MGVGSKNVSMPKRTATLRSYTTATNANPTIRARSSSRGSPSVPSRKRENATGSWIQSATSHRCFELHERECGVCCWPVVPGLSCFIHNSSQLLPTSTEPTFSAGFHCLLRFGKSVDNLLLTRRLSDLGYGSQPILLVRNCKASVCLGMNRSLKKSCQIHQCGLLHIDDLPLRQCPVPPPIYFGQLIFCPESLFHQQSLRKRCKLVVVGHEKLFGHVDFLSPLAQSIRGKLWIVFAGSKLRLHFEHSLLELLHAR